MAMQELPNKYAGVFANLGKPKACNIAHHIELLDPAQ